MIGLARMAWKLAKWRKYDSKGVDGSSLVGELPVPREDVWTGHTGAFGEYYLIIDRISAGEAP